MPAKSEEKADSASKHRPRNDTMTVSTVQMPAYSAGRMIYTCVERKAPLAGVCASGAGFALLFQGTLEVNLAAELHDSRVVSRGELAELGIAETGVNVLELSMVPGVEGFEANFQAAAASFAECEALEERQIPVVATRATETVVTEGAEQTGSRRAKGGRVKVVNLLGASRCAGNRAVRIRDLADQIRTSGATDVTGCGTRREVKRKARFHRRDTGNFPAANRGLHEAVRRMTEYRDVINEVGHEDMGAVR